MLAALELDCEFALGISAAQERVSRVARRAAGEAPGLTWDPQLAMGSCPGLARAPADFGQFSGKLLVGNFGDGRINAFDQFSGDFADQLHNEHGEPITIDALCGLRFGTATTGGTTTLLFSAGINGENDGLMGSINDVQ
jgi:uncharacterized protein (TIGR03118 family)